MNKAQKIVLIILFGLVVVTAYFNIGQYYYQTTLNVTAGDELATNIDEVFVVGHDQSLIDVERSRGVDTVESSKIFFLLLWPIVTLLSIGSWFVWFVFQGGILDLIGMEFLIPVAVILIGILSYFIFWKKK